MASANGSSPRAPKSTQMFWRRKPDGASAPGSSTGMTGNPNRHARRRPAVRAPHRPRAAARSHLGAGANGHRATARKRVFERVQPVGAGRQVPAVEEDPQTGFTQTLRQSLDQRVVTRLVAEKDIEVHGRRPRQRGAWILLRMATSSGRATHSARTARGTWTCWNTRPSSARSRAGRARSAAPNPRRQP